MALLDELLQEKGVDILRKANKRFIPVVNFGNDEVAADRFNQCYQEALKREWNLIEETKSGGVSISKNNFKPPMYLVSLTSAVAEMTFIGEGKMLRVQFRQVVKIDEDEIYGTQALSKLGEILQRKFDIDLNKYRIPNGREVKKEVPHYIIKSNRSFEGLELENCHHIDFHSSFPAGLANTHPEFRPAMEHIYSLRKKVPIMKAILNLSIGMFHSVKQTEAAWAHLAKDAISDNNKRIEKMTERLLDAERTPILWNTDGIWYIGEIYHGEGEGCNLGEWENDHTNCRLRIKSKGAYEFIEDGKYYPVIRGRTKLDRVRPREEWEWGDIFKQDAAPIEWHWEDGIGLVIGG